LNKRQKGSSSRHIWHLQASMCEEMEAKDAAPKNYSWMVAFPLPLT